MLFARIPEPVLAQVPQVPRDTGVMVTHVLPRSPAAQAGLQRHDLLLRYGTANIRGCTHFGQLVRDDKPAQTVLLSLLRGGKSMKVKVKLDVGPILHVGQSNVRGHSGVPPSRAKQGGPGQLSVSAVPMDGNRMKVTFEFYQSDAGRFRQVTCSGTPNQIDEQVVQRMPKLFQAMANQAIAHLRKLKFQRPK